MMQVSDKALDSRREFIRAEGAPCKPIPLLSSDVRVDDDDATIVVVFTRSTGAGGVVKRNQDVPDADAKFDSIFYRGGGGSQAAGGRPSGVMTAGGYQELVRKKFVQQLEDNGMKASTFEKFGGEEIFMKISLNREGSVIRSLAERYNYLMPFSEDVYPGKAPPINSDGDTVVAHESYKASHGADLAEFRNIDEIRLLHARLNSCANLAEMQNQQVISRYFPAAKHDAVLELNGQFISMKSFFRLPNYMYLDQVRSYFGERMAFLFQWFAFLVRSSICLAIAGGFCTVRQWCVDFSDRRYDQLGYAVFILIWAVCFVQLFKNKAARSKQRWGMDTADVLAEDLSSYDASLNGTLGLWAKKKLGPVIMLLYSIAFGYAIRYINQCKTDDIQNGGGPFLTYEPIIIAVVIKVGVEVWEHVVGPIVNLQNYRTQSDWEDAVSQIYAPVSILVNLLPFFTVAFLTRYWSPTCETSLEAAVLKTYSTGFPANTAAKFERDANGTIIGSTGLEFLDGIWWKDTDGRYCIAGCFPLECFESGECVSSCIKSLESSLLVTFITSVISCFVCLLIPIFLVKAKTRCERRKLDGDSSEGEAANQFSYLQFQAKCYDDAAWKFRSWGGSHIGTFGGLATSFALLTCFGMVLPVMAVIACVSLAMLFHLFVYARLNVNCRPFPSAAQGIGVWQDHFETIVAIAFVCNAGLVCFEMDPIRNWLLWERFAAFVVIHISCLAVRGFLLLLIPDVPEDVISVERSNHHFLDNLRKSNPIVVSAQDKLNNPVDISLGEGGSDSDE